MKDLHEPVNTRNNVLDIFIKLKFYVTFIIELLL